jgi:hypothetical protein
MKKKRKSRKAKPTTLVALGQVLELARLRIHKTLRAVEDAILSFSVAMELSTDEQEKASFREHLDALDSWLMEIIGPVSCAVNNRALESSNANLMGVACVCSDLYHLPDLLERLPESQWDDPTSADCRGFIVLDDLARVIRFIERDALEHPERYRLWAQEQPALPMMVFRNVRAYKRRFEKIVHAVKLGERCPINSDRRANYDLSKPVNSLVFDALMEFMRVISFLNWVPRSDKDGPITPERILRENAQVPTGQVQIFLDAYKLPALTKSSAYEWAYKAIIPYLETEHPDWLAVPALKPYIKPKGGRSKAKEVIAERLEGMARPNSSGRSPSSRWPS